MSSESRAAARPTRAVRHDEAAHRFEWTEDGHFCVLDYTLDGKVASFTHTGVPSAVGGRGKPTALSRSGLETGPAHG